MTCCSFGGKEWTFVLDGDQVIILLPTEDTYERNLIVDGEKTTLTVYDIWEQVSSKMYATLITSPKNLTGMAFPTKVESCQVFIDLLLDYGVKW